MCSSENNTALQNCVCCSLSHFTPAQSLNAETAECMKTFVVASMLLHPCSTDRLTKQMAQGNYVRLKTTQNTHARTHAQCSVSEDDTCAVVMQVATQSKS